MKTNVVVIGSGNLARAMVMGWKSPPSPYTVKVLARSSRYRERGWTADLREHVVHEPEVLKYADIIVVAVKPKDVAKTLAQVLPYASSHVTWLSVVAGLTIDQLKSFGIPGPIVRTMPNICAGIGRSVTGITFSSPSVALSEKERIMDLVSVLGHVEEVSEHDLNPLTSLTGSGPAYIFSFMETVTETAVTLGLDPQTARELVLRMIIGSAELALQNSQQSFQELITEVASPGGTTEALLNVLQDSGWHQILKDSLLAAVDRAQKLNPALTNSNEPSS